MTKQDKGLVMIWLSEIIDDPENYKMFYSDSEQKLLAEHALELISDIDCVDYVVTHRAYPIDEDDLYRTLCVGDYCNDRKDGEFSELDGDSIHEYNSRINECTGLYWIWKNTSSEYVGLSHYRRFFYRDAESDEIVRLNKRRIKEILVENDYDIILSLLFNLNWTVYHNMEMTIGAEFCETGYKLFYDAIMEKQPDYLDSYVDVFAHNRMYTCNMFVTRRDILNRYCEWLFSFLLDVADKFDVSSGKFGQTRAAGYFAEVMWTVWLSRQNLKIFELPIFRC